MDFFSIDNLLTLLMLTLLQAVLALAPEPEDA